MKKILIIIGFLVIFGILSLVGFVCNYAGRVIEVAMEEVDPAVLLDKYEWFKDASATLDKKIADINVYDARVKAVRDMAYSLSPASLNELGLVQTLVRHCEEFSARSGVKVDFFHAGMEKLAMGFDSQINLYRLVQEGLNNIQKHADASHAIIRLLGAFPNIILRIEDDGKGFDVRGRLLTATADKRMGLRSMQERVSLLGGTMTIRSKQGHGTRLFIKVPCKENKGGTKENHIDR